MAPREPSRLVIDADVLMNIVATGRAHEILAAGGGALLCPQVEAEVLYLEAEDEMSPPEPIDLGPLIASGVLERVSMSRSEVDRFVQFAAEVDDGEAQVIAVAVERAGLPATDDRRARRVAMDRRHEVIGTPEMLKHWKDASGVGVEEVRVAIERVERRAHFRPRRDHPLAPWWEDPKRT